MSTYRKEWDCCGSVTETQAWEPETCPFCTTQPAPIPVQAGEIDLLAALKPFADAYAPIAKHDDPNEEPNMRAALDRNTVTPSTTIGDFRRAHEVYNRAAIKAGGQGGEDGK